MPQATWPWEGPRPGCPAQSSGQEVLVQTMSWHHFKDSLPFADRNHAAGLDGLSASRKFRGSSVGTSLGRGSSVAQLAWPPGGGLSLCPGRELLESCRLFFLFL